ncbi:SAM-dependent methyltransferase [Spirillospora sp. NPDC047279]|uniref:SAM-dependent methyltransferase n=1 Tax=Spirillospora sp. NPDC047279 TaxID=3155478 RepID=UPI0034059953
MTPTTAASVAAESGSAVIDTSVPHSARLWNFLLGGKDNYPVDRQAGEQMIEIFPEIVAAARHSRAFLCRAVRFMTGEAGIRQFLDIGTGLPTVDNTHEIAQRIASDTKVVYVDNDPLVLVHARALLTSTADGEVDYVETGLHHPERIVAEASRTLDFTEPIGLLLLSVLDHVPRDEDVHAILATLAEAVTDGSKVALSWATAEVGGDRMRQALDLLEDLGGPALVTRSPQAMKNVVTGAGLELVDPGVVTCASWRPEPNPFGAPATAQFCCVARKARQR